MPHLYFFSQGKKIQGVCRFMADFDVKEAVVQIFECGEIVGRCMAKLSKLVSDVVLSCDDVSKEDKVFSVQNSLNWQRQARVL